MQEAWGRLSRCNCAHTFEKVALPRLSSQFDGRLLVTVQKRRVDLLA